MSEVESKTETCAPQQDVIEIEEPQLSPQVIERLEREEREREESERKRKIEEARAAINEDEDDTAEEKAEREEARQLLQAYDGDEFKAARTDDKDILRAYFLVHGSERMLSLRSKADIDGGRTLLHCAAFWNSMKCLNFLLHLGADPNVIDTVYSSCTPLLEAARAGHLQVCRKLLSEGARIEAQDKHGDTVFHWCARKGRGNMITHLLSIAEKNRPGSTEKVLLIENIRRRKPRDCSVNQSVFRTIAKEMESTPQRIEKFAKAKGKRAHKKHHHHHKKK